MAKFKDLKVGDILGESQYYEVEKIKGEKVQVKTSDGGRVVLNSEYVNTYLNSADQFSTTEKKTKTELADLFRNSSRIAMTVCFMKQDKVKTKKAYNTEIEEQAQKVAKGSLTVIEALKNPILTYTPGEARVMRGRHYGEMDDLGRISFTDMEVTSGSNLRVVDPRTIQWMIVNDVKYTLK